VELPSRPDGTVDRYLDALTQVLLRHGLERASVADVAAELGVSRMTVYRQAGNVDQMVRLLISRELHRLMETVTPAVAAANDADGLVDVMANVIEFLRDQPVVRKVLVDEPAVIGTFLVLHLPILLRRTNAISGPLLETMMEDGRLARQDPAQLADWLSRVVVNTVIAPPPGPIRDHLSFGVRPVLEAGRTGSAR
jgi:AcrR family transcriptional regulator